MRSGLLRIAAVLMVAAAALGGATVVARAQMPDPRQMAGRPLPVGDLPVGTVTVRVVRGAMTNVIAGQQVELSGAGRPMSATTDAQGRAEFPGLAPGTTVMAATVVDGERLESQPFAVPASGGVRVALVAGLGQDGGPAGATPAAPSGPVETGAVTLGSQSRFVVEMADEALSVFNLLEVVNPAAAAVQPRVPLVFELPANAQGAGALQASASQLTVAGTRVTAAGPFPPGSTLLQFGYSMPISGATLTFEQKLPAALSQFSLMAQKVGAMTVTSPQIAEHREMPVQDQTFIVAKGPAVAAGSAITLSFSGLPHQPLWPRNLALALAGLILAAGTWAVLRARPLTADEADRRRRLEAKRDRAFAELTALEEQHRAGAVAPDRYAERRRELVAALERLYAELDGEAAA